ncbi:MAG TPA: twin-arginine translocation signal domain-containing protein, partial [Anaerolineales bacterium]|nr:twin-arginine translocation signal domain-containing protein [Anaerolineales bacterium]
MEKSKRTRRPGSMSRRDFLKLGGLAGAAATLGSCAQTPRPGDQRVPTPVPPPFAATSAQAEPSVGVALRIAHITDMHIEPYGPGMDGLTRALRDIHSRTPAVDFVLNTGDCVMDTLEADKGRAEKQWQAFTDVMKAECRLPVFHAI